MRRPGRLVCARDALPHYIADRVRNGDANHVSRILAPRSTVSPGRLAHGNAPSAVGAGGPVWRPHLEILENRTLLSISFVFASLQEFRVPTAGAGPDYITPGPDGNVWFTESGADNIAYITPSGNVTEIPNLVTDTPTDRVIVTGPNTDDPNRADTSIYFSADTASGPAASPTIVELTPSGIVHQFSLPAVGSTGDLTLGPDGNIWFAEYYNNGWNRASPWRIRGFSRFRRTRGCELGRLTLQKRGLSCPMLVRTATTGKDSPMKQSTLAAMLPAIPDLRDVLEVLIRALPQFLKLIALIRRFRQEPVTPVRACAFENELAAIAREANRIIVEHEFNGIEPQRRDECPLRLRFAGEVYRRRPKSRKWVGSLFGEIELHRYLYQPVEPGEPALVPLEKQLGIEAGLATAALAERVGVLSVDHEQDQVRTLLQRQHNVCWSVHSLRKVTATLRDGLAPFREEAQANKLLELLDKALASKGKHPPTLAAGRDGIHVPIRKQGYHEGSTATVSVCDRRGKRLAHV